MAVAGTEEQSWLLDTPTAITSFLNQLDSIGLTTDPPALYIDLEGSKLAYHGHTGMLQICVSSPSLHRTVILDIEVLGTTAFTTPSSTEKKTTFKHILEAPDIPVVFHCVKNDQAALAGQFGILMQNVEDTQMLENAAGKVRLGSRQLGLRDCIERYIPDEVPEKGLWLRSKDEGKVLWYPKYGGTTEVFHQRPIHPVIETYAKMDVNCLPTLRHHLQQSSHPSTWAEAHTLTQAALLAAQQPPKASKRARRNRQHRDDLGDEAIQADEDDLSETAIRARCRELHAELRYWQKRCDGAEVERAQIRRRWYAERERAGRERLSSRLLGCLRAVGRGLMCCVKSGAEGEK